MQETPNASTTGASVFRGGLWNLASRVGPQLYLVIVSIAAARFLGPDDFGRQSFIAFVELSAVMLLTAGVPYAVSRYVAHAMGRGDSAGARDLVRWGWRTVSIGAALATAALAAAGLAGAEPRAAWLLAAVAGAAFILGRVPIAFLNGLQRWRDPSLVALATGAAATAASVAVLAAGGGITGMFAVQAAGAVAALLALVGLSARSERRLALAPRVDRDLRREALRYAGLNTVTLGLTFIIWRRTELFFLQGYSTQAQVGFYSIAFTAATVPNLVFQGFTGAMLPAVATLLGAGAVDRIRSGFSRAIRLLLFVAFPATAAAFALGPELITLLFGTKFDDVRPVLLILLLLMPIVPLIDASSQLLSGLRRLRIMVIAGVIAACVTIGLDFLLIPPYDAIGAAIANAGGQLTVGVPVMLYAWRAAHGVSLQPAMIARLALASALAGVAAWACVELLDGVVGVVVGASAGACLFALLGAGLRVLDPDDARWLDDTVGWVLGGLIGRLIRLWAHPAAAGPVP